MRSRVGSSAAAPNPSRTSTSSWTSSRHRSGRRRCARATTRRRRGGSRSQRSRRWTSSTACSISSSESVGCRASGGKLENGTMATTDLTAADVAWDLETLLPEPGEAGVKSLLDRADEIAAQLATARGEVAQFDADRLVTFVTGLADLYDLVGRAESYAGLEF